MASSTTTLLPFFTVSAAELHARAPLGAYVEYSDGTPRPPARFTKKLQAWKNHNGYGLFIKANPAGSESWQHATFTLMREHGNIVINRVMMANDNTLRFEVRPPSPGTILAYTEQRGGIIEVSHVWKNVAAARAWARGTASAWAAATKTDPVPEYKFAACGYKYYLVAEDGTLTPDYMPPNV